MKNHLRLSLVLGLLATSALMGCSNDPEGEGGDSGTGGVAGSTGGAAGKGTGGKAGSSGKAGAAGKGTGGQAGTDGVVNVAFTLNRKLPAGSHALQLTGWQSGRNGVAQFVVGDAAEAGVPARGFHVPPWLWWPIGAVALAALVLGGRRLIHVLNAPQAPAKGVA